MTTFLTERLSGELKRQEMKGKRQTGRCAFFLMALSAGENMVRWQMRKPVSCLRDEDEMDVHQREDAGASGRLSAFTENDKGAMKMTHTEEIFEAMRRCAMEGGRMMLSHGALKVEKKGANNFVTDIDKAIQSMVISSLREIVPDAFFIAEEKDNAIDLSGEGFIIDPIDGTHNFINGLPLSAVSIAYVRDGEAECAVVNNPFRKELFAAVRGRGAYLNEERISVRPRSLENALILTEDVWKGDRSVIRRNALGARILGSAELALCFVACGRAGGYLSPEIHIWDYAAGRLILEEAGGTLFQKDGTPLRLQEPNRIGACDAESKEALLRIWNEAEP